MNKKLLHPNKIQNIMKKHATQKETEIINIKKSLLRPLAKDVYAKIESPPFSKSAMDGYAYIKKNKSNQYKLIDNFIIKAGDIYKKSIDKNECIKIMTGAMIPTNARYVQRVEWTREIKHKNGDKLIEFVKEESSNNIIKQGINQKKGDILLSKRILKPKDLGILLSSGYSSIEVFKTLHVGVISTGNELIGAGKEIKPGKIYDSNGIQTLMQSLEIGLDAKFYGIVKDDLNKTKSIFEKALKENDILIISGGVSMGDFDYIPQALKDLDFSIILHGLSVKPGKPSLFAKKDNKAVFGLPGNPVSSFVIFNILVLPYIYACYDIEYKENYFKATLKKSITKKESDRVEYLPAIVEMNEDDIKVIPIKYHGSSMLNALAFANAFIKIEIGINNIEEGEKVNVRLI